MYAIEPFVHARLVYVLDLVLCVLINLLFETCVMMRVDTSNDYHAYPYLRVCARTRYHVYYTIHCVQLKPGYSTVLRLP